MITLALSVAILAAAAADPPPKSEPTTVSPIVAVAPEKNEEKPRPDETVCKREPVLGSRMKQRICMTYADWEIRKADARDEVEKAQTNQPRPR